MKYLPLVILFLLTAVTTSPSLSAQETVPVEEQIVITPTELKGMIRKMAELRRRRVLLYQQQMQRNPQRAPRPEDGRKAYREEVEVIRQANGTMDTVVTVMLVDAKDLNAEEEVPSARSGKNVAGSPDTVFADNRNELAELRRRLDRQEELLLEIRDRTAFASTTNPAPAAAPTKADTIINRIVVEGNADGLSKEDLRELTQEVSQMNDEIGRLRERLRYEEYRRRRAEEEMVSIMDRNEENNRERENNRTQVTTVPAPVVVQQESPVRIVRDTVYVDREVTTPVFLPGQTKTDTVIIREETVREVPAEPLVVTRVEEREVVRTDTLKMKATEPIGFPTIFFDNNSSQLNTAHRNLLSNVVSQLAGRPGYELRLTGFSSKSGNAAYNQTLSAKRAEAVRQGLIDAGWAADKIVTVPGGIDFQPASPAAARRVEVQALPR